MNQDPEQPDARELTMEELAIVEADEARMRWAARMRERSEQGLAGEKLRCTRADRLRRVQTESEFRL